MLFHSGTLGHRLTAREVLSRQLREERLGIDSGTIAEAGASKSRSLLVAVDADEDDDDVDSGDGLNRVDGAVGHSTRNGGGAVPGAMSAGATGITALARDQPVPTTIQQPTQASQNQQRRVHWDGELDTAPPQHARARAASCEDSGPGINAVATAAAATRNSSGSRVRVVGTTDTNIGLGAPGAVNEAAGDGDDDDGDDDGDDDDGSGDGEDDADEGDADEDERSDGSGADDDEGSGGNGSEDNDDDDDDDDADGSGSSGKEGDGSGKGSVEVAPAKPSAFSFTVRLPSSRTGAAAAASQTTPADGAPAPATVQHAAVHLDAVAASVSAARAAALPTRDEAVEKLEALRARNAALGSSAAPSTTWSDGLPRWGSDADGGDAEEDKASAAAAAARAAAGLAVARAEKDAFIASFASAGALLAAQEAAGRAGSESEAEVDVEAGAKGRQARRRRGSAAPTSAAAADDDAYLERAAMWSADGTRMIGTPVALAMSSLSAYAPLPSTIAARPRSAAEARAELPVTQMEAEIMDSLSRTDVLLLAGETGSGKTTQAPQFLWELGYGAPSPVRIADSGDGAAPNPFHPNALYRGYPGAILVTQPRRVAAVAMATRVAAEVGSAVSHAQGGGLVGYKVRYDGGTVGPRTRIAFVTDGVLLRELASDILLRRYSVVIVDEAHERSINTDVLIGLLSRAVPLRNAMAAKAAEDARAAMARGEPAPPSSALLGPLKLIIMSATLRVADFSANARLFRVPPPVVTVAARQFPVSLHFARRTELRDYVGAAADKAAKIHTRLPPDGGILVFLTGAAEVEDVCARLRARFDDRKRRARRAAQALLQQPAVPVADAASPATSAPVDADTDGGAASAPAAVDGAAVSDGDEDAQWAPVTVLPLYALLPPEAQRRVFQPPPEGHRLIVVATNVAETSLTIPGIR